MPPEKKSVVTIRFTKEQADRLKQGARQEFRSTAGQVEFLVMRWLDEAVPVLDEPEPGPAPPEPQPEPGSAPRWDLAKYGPRGPFWRLPDETKEEMHERLKPPDEPREDDDGPPFP